MNQDTLDTMTRFLWGFMTIAVVLELMDVLSLAYEQTERWAVLEDLITNHLWYSYVVFQLLICSLGAFILLSFKVLFPLPRRLGNAIVFISSILLLLQVLLMRWNVVIGGQIVSKSFRGFTSFFPGLFAKEGLIVAGVLLIIPFLLLWRFDKLFPFFPPREPKVGADDYA